MYYAKQPGFSPDFKKPKSEKVEKPKTKPLSLVEKLDRVFSIFIRKSAANDGGIARCYTCNCEYYWKDLQCGHWQNRVNMGTRFSEINCKPQCFGCNVENRGEYVMFGVQLAKDYGLDVVESLMKDAKNIKKITPEELKEGIEYYKAQNKKFEHIK